MKLELGKYTRVFAWTPVRFLERDPNEANTYEMKTAFMKHVWVIASRAQGGGAVLKYKSDAVYKREWYETVMSRIDTDYSEEEILAFFARVGVSHTTHQTSEAIDSILEFITNDTSGEN